MDTMSPLFLSILLIIFLKPHSLSAQRQQNITSFSSSDKPWLPDQNQVLVSPNSTFAAGFRPLTSPPGSYSFSVWYFSISNKTIVWSASVKKPIERTFPLVITGSGELRINGSSGENLWPNSTKGGNGTELILKDDGNLVYGSWESFDFPTNTILPGQLINGTGIRLASNNGKYQLIDSKGLYYNSNESYWNASQVLISFDTNGTITKGNGETSITSDLGEARLRRMTLDDDGNLIVYSFDPELNQWTSVWQAMFELCKIQGRCGPNFICTNFDNSNSTSCVCPPGYSGRGEDSCERRIPINEPRNSKFLRLDYVLFRGSSNQTDLKARNYAACEAQCMRARNCLGFSFKYDGSGYCVLQLDRLIYGYWSPGTEAVTFLRVASSENETSDFVGMTNLLETTCPIRISLPEPPEESSSTTRNIVIISTLFAAELISGVIFFWAFLKKYVKYRDMAQTFGLEFLPAGGPKRFSYAELKVATNNFSNIIGRGGFGDVYRGELTDHRVVAVKRLKNITAAEEKKGEFREFWAEVTIIARMHHLNLVRLWGFCAEKGHRILVYEYVPNGSLDKYLFRVGENRSSGDEPETDAKADTERKPVLDWNIRYRIALGVARAIAYLHEECLEWVLHRDIKPENILLGDDFCPKVADFGLAKLKKKEKENVVNISRIQGTPGYMAPEWAKSDTITPKADVYSFGMVLLEIVSGVRNREIQGSRMDSEDWYFPMWAFDKVFKEMNVEDILDSQIKHTYDSRSHFDMVNRMVKTAMWCLQDRPEMRPSMGKVAKMLEGTVEIIEPKKPTIFFISDDQ
ncbi:hypothetical protein DCAR_0832781 [Daucus carota subsp. sativus]|uniref:Receptor-like serine/threonine-protein kinase n=1 Tax=Daucus carota subsp. sativus TaxID=79200 RepID=A0A175YQ77_DAUCS|nr:PREDICTED: G-type lectin S-receptor-like serine/threonine-protein kinase At1g34300 [Daucus carota subsp. sativus]WOH13272.1 hypothetical protein DCAR_0832781 [Daucus carota subsp. sativus]